MSESKNRTITMTERAPVRICDDEWPVIASASEIHECGQHGQNGKVQWTVRVRRHKDGRALIYGTTSGACQCRDYTTDTPDAGRLLGVGVHIVDAVTEVAGAILPADYGSARGLAQGVMADLPAEVI